MLKLKAVIDPRESIFIVIIMNNNCSDLNVNK